MHAAIVPPPPPPADDVPPAPPEDVPPAPPRDAPPAPPPIGRPAPPPKKQVLSIEEILRKKKEADDAAAKVCFGSCNLVVQILRPSSQHPELS